MDISATHTFFNAVDVTHIKRHLIKQLKVPSPNNILDLDVARRMYAGMTLNKFVIDCVILN